MYYIKKNIFITRFSKRALKVILRGKLCRHSLSFRIFLKGSEKKVAFSLMGLRNIMFFWRGASCQRGLPRGKSNKGHDPKFLRHRNILTATTDIIMALKCDSDTERQQHNSRKTTAKFTAVGWATSCQRKKLSFSYVVKKNHVSFSEGGIMSAPGGGVGGIDLPLLTLSMVGLGIYHTRRIFFLILIKLRMCRLSSWGFRKKNDATLTLTYFVNLYIIVHQTLTSSK